MITRDHIETAYCFLHQKERVYAHSAMEWQKDDIEYAISSYVEAMNPELYRKLAGTRKDFLSNHLQFHEDMLLALQELEEMMR